MGTWTQQEMIDCTRYGKLIVFCKKFNNGKCMCRRVRRNGTFFYIESERLTLSLPYEFDGGRIQMSPGDLVFMATDSTCTILRNENDEPYFTMKSGRIRSNNHIIKGE